MSLFECEIVNQFNSLWISRRFISSIFFTNRRAKGENEMSILISIRKYFLNFLVLNLGSKKEFILIKMFPIHNFFLFKNNEISFFFSLFSGR